MRDLLLAHIRGTTRAWLGLEQDARRLDDRILAVELDLAERRLSALAERLSAGETEDTWRLVKDGDGWLAMVELPGDQEALEGRGPGPIEAVGDLRTRV